MKKKGFAWNKKPKLKDKESRRRRGRRLKKLKKRDYVKKLRPKELGLSKKPQNKLKKRKRKDLGLQKKKE